MEGAGPVTDSLEVIVARVETRLIAVERDVRDIKTENNNRRPSWPSVVSAVVAASALLITLVNIL